MYDADRDDLAATIPLLLWLRTVRANAVDIAIVKAIMMHFIRPWNIIVDDDDYASNLPVLTVRTV